MRDLEVAKTRLPISIWGVPVRKWAGRLGYSHMGNPHFRIEFVFIWGPTSTLECTLIGHVGFQPLTMDSRSNPTPEGFEPLTKSSRSNFPTNCTLWHPLKHVFKNNFKSNFKNNFKSMTWCDMAHPSSQS